MSDVKTLSAKVRSLEQRVAALEARFSTQIIESDLSNEKEMSVKEFMLSKKPSGDVQKALTIAYYLEKYEGFSRFNIDDIVRGFELAKESIPININDKINMNIRKGHMTEAREGKDDKKAWMVTNSGEQFISSGFKKMKK